VRDGLVLFQPRPHAGLRHGLGDARGGQLGGVVLDVQPLAEKPDAEQPLFGKVEGDLGGEAQEPIQPARAFEGEQEIELQEADVEPEGDDDRVLGDD